MHPAACLLAWLCFAVAVQGFSALALVLCALLLLGTGKGIRRRWWRLAWRAKLLLLSLWLILAYGTPGELIRAMSWAPSLEGLEAANLHAARLLLLIGSLGALFEALPRQRFLAALWSLARPLAWLGLAAERSVVRLALVFDYVENAPQRGSWRHFLEAPAVTAAEAEHLTIEIQHWRRRDGVALLAFVVALAALWVWA